MDAALYSRISRDREGTGLGVARQLSDCRALAESRGWAVVDEFTDDDISAFSGKHRPAYAELLAGIAEGRYSAIVAWHSDRLHRSPLELEDFITVVEAAGCAVATCRAGDVDLGTASGRMSARVVGAVARNESEQKSERLRRKHQELAEAGRFKGGRRPYGYTVPARKPGQEGRLDVVEDEAAVIRSAAARVLGGETVYSVVRDLNDRMVPTATGALWRPQTLRRIITNPTTAGLREYRGEVVGPAEWPAILDPADRAKLAGIIEDPSRARGQVPRVALLASGLARCARCGSKLITQRRTTGARVYVCLKGSSPDACGRLSIQANPLEEVVTEALLIRLDTPALAEAMRAKPDDSGAAEDLAAIEHRLDELADMFASGEIDRAGWLRARRGLEARQEAATAVLRRSQRLDALDTLDGPGALRSAWPGLNLDRRRAVVAAIIDRVTVAPATRRGPVFDAGRVDVTWRV